ncbi:MAG TPA: thiosulfate oxidation carrier complex protein SoxZ [Burkholderiaceae bacterium]|nr:thiosulfate oxidation carrier complex protein SoxZ [Burkholderiaceae bacterium]
MPDAMRIRANMQGEKVAVRVLMSHIMETGQRKDASGKIVSAWFIQNVVAKHNNRVVLDAQFGPAVSQNPLLAFTFAGGKPGEKVQVTWTDNRGESRSDEATIA